MQITARTLKRRLPRRYARASSRAVPVLLLMPAALQLEHLEGSRQVLQREFEEELAQARQQVNVVSADHAKQRVQLVADSEHFKYEVRPGRPSPCMDVHWSAPKNAFCSRPPVLQLTRVQAELKVCQQEREKASVAFRACEQAKALMDIELKVRAGGDWLASGCVAACASCSSPPRLPKHVRQGSSRIP